MDVYTKNKYLFWSLVFFGLLNTMLLVILIIQIPNKPDRMPKPDFEKGPPGKHRMKDFMKSELNLNSTQESKFDKIMEGHFDRIDSAMSNIMTMRQQILEEIFADNVNQSKLDSLSVAIGNQHQNLEKMNINHFIELKSILNLEQLKKAKEMMRDMIRLKAPKNKPKERHRDRL